MSNPTFDASFAEALASLQREVPVQTTPYAYGRDLSCELDATDDFAEVDPNSTRAIGEACVRRLITQRGSLPGDRDYGLDLRAYLNRGTTAQELRDLGSRIRLELKKDDRVSECDAQVSSPTAAQLSVRIMITPADPSLDQFALTFDVTDAGIVNVEIG
jgi:hypothetical protein